MITLCGKTLSPSLVTIGAEYDDNCTDLVISGVTNVGYTTIHITRPDGTVFQDVVDVVDGVVTYPILRKVTVAGRYTYKLKFIGGESICNTLNAAFIVPEGFDADGSTVDNTDPSVIEQLQQDMLLRITDAPVDGLTYGRKDAEWVEVTGSGSGGVTVHNQLTGRDATDAHSQGAITNLPSDLQDIRDDILAIPAPVTVHNTLTGRSVQDAHPQSAITGLPTDLQDIRNDILAIPAPITTHSELTGRDAVNSHPQAAITNLPTDLQAIRDSVTNIPAPVTVHNDLTGRTATGSHPQGAITNLTDDLNAIRASIPLDAPTLSEVQALDAIVLSSANANTEQQVAEEAAMRESADAGLMDLIDGLTLPTLTADLFFKSGGAMNQEKPTGAGTTLAGSTMNTTEQLLYTFTYAAPEAFILYANNHYTLNFPWNTLATNRDYVFRYNYLVGASQVLNETRPSFRPTGTSFTEEFQAVNNLALDVNVPAGTTITMRVYGRVLANTSAIGLRVDDATNKARISRNEQSATVSATNVTTLTRGTVESQENLNNYLYSLISNVPLPTAPAATISTATYAPAFGLYSTFPLTVNANTTIDLTGLPIGTRTLMLYMGATLRTVAFSNAAGGLRTISAAPVFAANKLTPCVLKYDGVSVSLYSGKEV